MLIFFFILIFIISINPSENFVICLIIFTLTMFVLSMIELSRPNEACRRKGNNKKNNKEKGDDD